MVVVAFTALTVVTGVCGCVGGWMFGNLSKTEIPQDRKQYFKAASVIMLAQDVIGHMASVYFAVWFGVSFTPLYRPVFLSAGFFLFVFTCPAFGYLLAQLYC
jgi:predicted membrane protein